MTFFISDNFSPSHYGGLKTSANETDKSWKTPKYVKKKDKDTSLSVSQDFIKILSSTERTDFLELKLARIKTKLVNELFMYLGVNSNHVRIETVGKDQDNFKDLYSF